MKTKVIGIVGPTAVGKTELGIDIGEWFNGEVISGDAMQVYKGMDIGTAKISLDKTRDIPHHMIDIKHPNDPFTVADFQQHAQRLIDQISVRDRVPILVGGSGLYVQAVLYNYQFANRKRDPAITARLEAQVESEGVQSLHDRLKQVDPVQAQNIHPNNVRRVIRALETFQTTGTTLTDYHQSQSLSSPYEPYLIGLAMDREQLYKRINERVDRMIATGLIQEVAYLYREGYGEEQSMQAIGYKEIIAYLKNDITLNTAIDLLKRNSRRYAKRQYTWFKNKMNVHWYSASDLGWTDEQKNIYSDLAGFLKDI